MNDDIIIRTATSDDAAHLTGLLDVLGYPADVDAIARRLRHISERNGEVFVADQDGAIVGLAVLHIIPLIHYAGDLGRMSALVVLPSAHGRGIGRSLVDVAETRARLAGCSRMEVTSGAQRSSAHAFYEAIGYARSAGARFLKPLT